MDETKETIISTQHLLETIRSGTHTFDLEVEGMKVPDNIKTITLIQEPWGIEHLKVKHHRANITVNIKEHELDDTNKTQIGLAIVEHRLKALH